MDYCRQKHRLNFGVYRTQSGQMATILDFVERWHHLPNVTTHKFWRHSADGATTITETLLDCQVG